MSGATNQRGYRAQLFNAAVWALTIVLLLIAGLRVVCHDATNLLTCLNAFTRYIYLPSYACLMYAVWKRQWRLAIANLILVTCHVVWLAPDVMRDARVETLATNLTANEAPRRSVRVMFANVWYLNPDYNACLREIERVDPDVVLLAEFPWTWRGPFSASPIMSKYSYGHDRKPWHYEQVVAFSRLPVKGAYERTVTDRIVQFLDVAVEGKTLHLIGLHSPRPTYFRQDDYAGYWRELIPFILQAPQPLVVIGDFNATQHSRVYQQLKASGLRSAHEDRGRGYATTWPNGQSLVPPIRIDQAFLSSDVVCRQIDEGVGKGSDHKPLILDLAFPAAR